jgi:hypothetical protein
MATRLLQRLILVFAVSAYDQLISRAEYVILRSDSLYFDKFAEKNERF